MAYESTSKCWPTISLYFRETKTLSSLQAVSRGRNFQERARYPPAYTARAQYKNVDHRCQYSILASLAQLVEQ